MASTPPPPVAHFTPAEAAALTAVLGTGVTSTDLENGTIADLIAWLKVLAAYIETLGG